MASLFTFGEEVEHYSYRVINEREARASAGIMFLLGIISLFTVFGMRTLFWAELFSITFIVEFFVRVFINPRYAPYMVMGSLFVSNQAPEWVEAKPKKFAWILGALLGAIMTYFIVANIVSPVRMLTCVLCLILLFSESAFGICLGCILYKKFNVTMEGNCPGGVCESVPRHNRTGAFAKIAIMGAFVGLIVSTFSVLTNYKYVQHAQSQKVITAKMNQMVNSATSVPVRSSTEPTQVTRSKKDCEVPQFAIDMGHRDMWLEHNNCPPIKKVVMQVAALSKSVEMNTKIPSKTIEKPKAAEPKVVKKECVAPEWAVKIGHKEMWEKHNC